MKPPKKKALSAVPAAAPKNAGFALIAELKRRALQAQRAAKKSEPLRAGLRALAGMSNKALVGALDRLEPVKAGRPKKRH
jgi:hypothetical protein